MAEKTAQELFTDARKRLTEVGQHGIAYDFDRAWIQARVEHAIALDALKSVPPVPVVPETPVSPQGEPGEGGGASSQAGVESKEPLPGGVIA